VRIEARKSGQHAVAAVAEFHSTGGKKTPEVIQAVFDSRSICFISRRSGKSLDLEDFHRPRQRGAG
jgi:hypothetical protein